MQTLCFIVCHMGPLPDYFRLWLHTCARNPTVDWLVFSDADIPCTLPPNVRAVRMTLAEVRERLAARIPCPITLNRPYKLCDYKPAYGEAFADYLTGYDLWGFCDTDVLWGSIRTFLNDEILTGYRRVLTRGHCSLFRNDPETNALYRTLPPMGSQDWRTVYSTDETRAFDEWAGHLGGGLSEIYRRNGIPQYDEPIYLGPNFLKAHLYLEETPGVYNREYCVLLQDGRLYAAMPEGNAVLRKEYLYFHFQKRPPVIRLPDPLPDAFAFLPPNRVVPLAEDPDAAQLRAWMKVRGLYLQPLKFRLGQLRTLFLH